jgi:MFS family permease
VLYGLSWTAYAVGGATGPVFIGHMYDRAGAYHSIFIVYLAVVAFAAAGVSLLLRRTPRLEESAAGAATMVNPISLEE